LAKKRFSIGFRGRQILGGLLFTFPFIIGFTLFFLYPFAQAVIFSFNKLELGRSGYSLVWQGLGNFRYALLQHADFNETFVNNISSTLSSLPMIIGFSLFAATLLNQKFRGRAVARMILFLPVILGAGVVLRMETGDWAYIMAQEAANANYFAGSALQNILGMIRLPGSVVDYLIDVIRNSPRIIRASGVQILIFLAGLQSIPPTVYEAADVEGATGWEKFWLITFPGLSPLILTNLVYTIIDSFTTPQNSLISLIEQVSFTGAGFGVGMAMSMLYFLFIAALLAFIYVVLSRFIFYNV